MVTLGCRVNQYEMEYLRNQWIAAGGLECADIEDAEYICINSCAVTSNAERESRNALYRAKRSNPRAHIIMTGCAARLLSSFKPRKNAFWASPDAIVCNKNDLLAGPQVAENLAHSQYFFPPSILEASAHSRPVVKIQDGCDHNCTYCIVPQSRGKPQSRSPQDILAEVSGFRVQGRAEIVLSGINLHLYGKDNNDFGDFWDFFDYLEAKLESASPDTFRIRLSSLDPSLLNEKALDVIGRSKLLCPHVHLSIQHASKDILRKMGRGHYSAEKISDSISKILAVKGKFGLGADFIVGFPGETDNDFMALLEFIQTIPLSYAHIFPFSSRPGTPAATFPDQLPGRVKHERSLIARKLVKERRQAFLAEQLELEKMFVVREASPDKIGKGINEYYIPCYFQNTPENNRAIFRARPVKQFKDGLWVEP